MTTISNKLAPAQVVAELNGLATDRAAWENGSYKASNDELYGLLDRCFALLQQMKGQRKLIKELNELLTENGIVFNEGTSLATKIARFVFNENNKRITGYAKVLRVAAEEKAENENFAAFIRGKGGIDEVRKQKASGELSKSEIAKNLIEFAEGHFAAAEALVTDFACVAPEVHPNADKGLKYSAALLRKNDDGTFSIVFGCSKVPVVNVLLAEAGKVAERNVIANVAAEQRTKSRKARTSAVTVAANRTRAKAKPTLKLAA